MRIFLFTMLIVFGVGSSLIAQRTDPQRLADRNEELELLMITYKEKLQNANSNIKRLQAENYDLQKNIGVLLKKPDKSSADIIELQRERQQLLVNKRALQFSLKEREKTIRELEALNRKLKTDNKMLKQANELLEEAAMASDTIQKYQDLTINKQKESIDLLISSYAQKCSGITAQYRLPFSKNTVNVVMEETQNVAGPNNRQIENLKVKACYQLQNPEASEKITVYFFLYKGNKSNVLRKTAFTIPKTEKNYAVSYYEGFFILNTEGKYKLSDDSDYYYEIKYLERVIAKGIFKPS